MRSTPAFPWSIGCARWVEEGLEVVLSRKAQARPSVPRIFDGEKEARLIARPAPNRLKGVHAGACGFWRARCELGIVEAASDLTIQRTLKKRSSAAPPQYWVIPPKASGAFVAAMEDVLSVYTPPREPDRPLVCLDETSKQLVAETRLPVAMQPGRPAGSIANTSATARPICS